MIKRVSLAMLVVASVLSMNMPFAAQETHAAKIEHVATAAQQPSPVSQAGSGFPVLFADVEIFRITNSPISSLTPENRASIIQKNIQEFADSEVDTQSLKVTASPDGLAIGNDTTTLMLVTREDAQSLGKLSADLSKEILNNIQAAVVSYRNQHAWHTYGLGAAFTLLAIFGLWMALHWNNRAFFWLMKKSSSMHDYWERGVHYKEIEVLSARRIENMVLFALKALRIFVMLLCLYFFLPLTLSFFPETRKMGSRVFDYLITPFSTIFHKMVGFIPNLFFIFVIGVVAFYVLKVISYVFTLIERGELTFEWFYEDWARPTYQIIRFLVIVTALISAYPYIPGSSSQAFQGIGLVLGAIISFASSSAISNIVAGIILTYTRAFKLNDRVKVGETIGDVAEKTLLVTRIKTIKHVVVTIPNSLVMGSQIINYSTSAEEEHGVILHSSITIGYDVSWKEVEALLIEAALATEKIMGNPMPFVLKTALNDWYVSYEINASTKEPEHMATIYSNLHKNILDKFDAAGVEIMSPHYYALRDGNASTVPSVLGEPGYTQPIFKTGH